MKRLFISFLGLDNDEQAIGASNKVLAMHLYETLLTTAHYTEVEFADRHDEELKQYFDHDTCTVETIGSNTDFADCVSGLPRQDGIPIGSSRTYTCRKSGSSDKLQSEAPTIL